MKRFRVTLLVVCLLLGWLGFNDLSLYLRNRTPQAITIEELAEQGAPREWLRVDGGYQDLQQAINMSGTMEIDSFLVPLKASAETDELLIWFETRDPHIVNTLKTYYFKMDSDQARADFLEENRRTFFAQRDLTGMAVGNLIADSNKNKLEKLLTEMGIPVSERIIFISEGKEPTIGRGLFFLAMALLGLGRLLFTLLSKPAAAAPGKSGQ